MDYLSTPAPSGDEALSLLSPGSSVLVAGARVTGRAIVAALADWDVEVSVFDDDISAAQTLAGSIPESLRSCPPGDRALGAAEAIARIDRFDVVVTSPGFPPTAPVLAAAASAGVPIWGDVELAWRLDAAGRYGPPRRWLVVTGTNGKTTTTSMLYDMLIADGRQAILCGNIGEPVLDVLPRAADILAVEISSFQLHWAPSVRPDAAAVLNIAEDHLDWHGGFEEYAAAKARALDGRVAVVGLDDARAAALLPLCAAEVKAGFRLGEPAPGELGVRDGVLVDRAFADDLPLAAVSTVPVAGPVGVLDALGAAALARAVGVSAEPIAAALAGFRVGRHRAEKVGEIEGVTYVDDSKATNPHAAQASVLASPRVVWVAGGLLKGAAVDETVARVADRLAAAILIGRDRAVFAEALSRHAPNVPVIELVTREDAVVHETDESAVTNETQLIDASGPGLGWQVMAAVVDAAAKLARPGDTVLLAPAGASFDQFTGYGDRGEAFAAAVRDRAAGKA